MRRPILCAAVAAVAAVVLAVALPASAPAATKAITYLPFAADGALAGGLRASTAFGASCDSASFAVVGALRCAAGVTIRDPCWLDLAATTPQRTIVVCAEDPWMRTVVRLRLTAPPPEGPAPVAVAGRPWALRLSSGRRCVYVTGAAASLRGSDHARANYACGHGRVLFGLPDRRAATWRIRAARTPGGSGLRKVSIAVAYL